MKISIKDLKPNPFRNFDSLPYDEAKLNSLVDSINKTTFWNEGGGILARKVNGKYEMAFGHHRIKAAKKAGITVMDVTVKDLSDEQMIRLMAYENMDIWKADVHTIRATVRVVKEHLEKELQKAGSDFTKHKNSKRQQRGKYGKITADDVAWFLDGPWKGGYQRIQIAEALAQLRDISDGVIEEKTLRKVPTATGAKIVREKLRDRYSHLAKEGEKKYQPPKDDEERKARNKIADKFVEEYVNNDPKLYSHDYFDLGDDGSIKGSRSDQKAANRFNPDVKRTEAEQLERWVERIKQKARNLNTDITGLLKEMDRLEVVKMNRGPAGLCLDLALAQLLGTTNTLITKLVGKMNGSTESQEQEINVTPTKQVKFLPAAA